MSSRDLTVDQDPLRKVTPEVTPRSVIKLDLPCNVKSETSEFPLLSVSGAPSPITDEHDEHGFLQPRLSTEQRKADLQRALPRFALPMKTSSSTKRSVQSVETPTDSYISLATDDRQCFSTPPPPKKRCRMSSSPPQLFCNYDERKPIVPFSKIDAPANIFLPSIL